MLIRRLTVKLQEREIERDDLRREGKCRKKRQGKGERGDSSHIGEI